MIRYTYVFYFNKIVEFNRPYNKKYFIAINYHHLNKNKYIENLANHMDDLTHIEEK